MRRRTRIVSATVAACVAVAAAGYGVTRAFGAGSSCGRSPIARETRQLLAGNGLYYVPQLRGTRDASLYDSAYGLLTLQALGQPPATRPTASDLDRLRRADDVDSPIWSRWYLLAIQRATGQPVLSTQDARTVAGTLTRDGYFDDRPAGSPEPSPAEQVALSAAALDILSTVDGEGYTRSLTSTKRWIAALPDQFADNPYVLSLIAGAMAHLGLPVPPRVVQDVLAWYPKLRANPAQQDFSTVSHDLYGYTRVLAMAGRTPQPDLNFLAPLFQAAVDQDDLQDAYYAAASWATLSGDRDLMAPLARRLGASLTRDGLVQEQLTDVGTIDASYELVRILQAKGVPGCSALTRSALDAAKAQLWTGWDPIDRAMWLATVQLVGGKVDTATRWAVHDALVQELPPAVTPSNAKQWAMVTELLRSVGGPIPRPAATPWPVDDRLGVMAAAMLVNGVHAAGQPLTGLSWIRQQDLAAALTRPELTPTLQEYLGALDAFLALGGQLSGAQRTGMRARLDRVRGCPGLPDLMRSAPEEQTCDLLATRAALDTAALVA